MKLIVVRHGETIENIQDICQGNMDGTLSELGIEQAKKLALRFQGEKFDAVYSSSLGRAVNTAKEIMKYHPELDLQLDKRLIERHVELDGQIKKNNEIDWENLPKGSESWEDVQERVKSFIDEIYKIHKNDIVLLVTHGGVKIIILSIIYHKPIFEVLHITKVDNTSVSIFDIEEDGNHKVHLVNCTKHLEE